MNKIKISTPKISLINNIGTQTNYPSKYTLSIVDSVKNVNLANKATSTMVPVIMSKYMAARLLDGIVMESLHVSTLQIPVISKQAIHIHMYPNLEHPH